MDQLLLSMRRCSHCDKPFVTTKPSVRFCGRACSLRWAEQPTLIPEQVEESDDEPIQEWPLPEEIAAACAAIQETWSPAERIRRMRADWRPQRWRTMTAALPDAFGDFQHQLR